jgi:hypothetical protein
MIKIFEVVIKRTPFLVGVGIIVAIIIAVVLYVNHKKEEERRKNGYV